MSRVPPSDSRCYPPRGPALLDASNAATFAAARRAALLAHRDPEATQREIGILLRAGESGRLNLDAMARRIAELASPPLAAAQRAGFREPETPAERAARQAAATTRLLDADPATRALFEGTCGRAKLDWYCLTTPNGGFIGVRKGAEPPSRDWIKTGAIPEWRETITDAAGNKQVLTHTEAGIKHPCCYPRDKSCDEQALGRWKTRAGGPAALSPDRPRTILVPGLVVPIPLPSTPPPAPPPTPTPGDSPGNCIHVTGLYERTYLGVDGRWYCVRGTL